MLTLPLLAIDSPPAIRPKLEGYRYWREVLKSPKHVLGPMVREGIEVRDGFTLLVISVLFLRQDCIEPCTYLVPGVL